MKKLKISEYIALTGVSRQTVNNRINSNKLKTEKVGRNVFIILNSNDPLFIKNQENKKQSNDEKKDNESDLMQTELLKKENNILSKQIEDLRKDIDFLKNELVSANRRIDTILMDKREANQIMGAFQKAMGLLGGKTDKEYVDTQEQGVEVKEKKKAGGKDKKKKKKRK